MDTIEKERELSQYVKDWVYARIDKWMEFYNDVSQDRRNGIYRLKNGTSLYDLFNTIIGNIENHLWVNENQSLIPTNFSSIDDFLRFITLLNNDLNSKRRLLEKNICGENTSYIVADMLQILDEFNSMRQRCWLIYRIGDELPSPYEKVIRALHNNDLDGFIEIMKNIISDVPYLIHKEPIKEGYFHTLFHVITSVIGFKPISEKASNKGRMDMRIETPSTIFIMEFKYSSGDKNLSKEALKQIIDKEYANSEKLGNKSVVGVGISFSKKDRNINGFKPKTLYTPLY